MNKNGGDRNYGAGNIKVLEGLEPVRVRPGMYIGSTGSKGLHHLIYEVVDNSIDEALAGVCDTITVTIHKDNYVSIEDNGSGIPTEVHPQTGKSTVETVLTILHAGGKFDNSSYKVSGGLHGVGVSVVNALSTELIATVKRGGKIYSQRFQRGVPMTDLEIIGDTKERGTTIKFLADDTIFDTTEYSADILEKRFKEMAFLNRGVKITLIDERNEFKKDFFSEGGLKSFVEYINQNKNPISGSLIYFEVERENALVEVAMQYTDSFSESSLSFANNINTEEGGTHLAGFRSAITRTVNDYGRKYNIIKEKEENLSGDDCREGLTSIISVKLSNPQFEGQTKAKLGNAEIRGLVDNICTEEIGNFLEENPKAGKAILDKALQARRAREAARKARDLTRKRSILDSMSLPGKLVDCQSNDLEENEIFLVEGDSAGGSAKGGRDNKYQAILALKGKIMNVEKARLDKILGYEEIKAMITALGTNIGNEFNIENLRYGKVIIMTDADVDGAHIRTLLLTFFYRYMKPLIETGHIYIAQPPLYGILKGSKVLKYCYDKDELDIALEEIGRENIKIQRYKGLGEMNAEQLWATTMDPENRVLLKVEMEESVETDRIFTTLMGEKVDPRREFIEENALFVKNLDA